MAAGLGHYQLTYIDIDRDSYCEIIQNEVSLKITLVQIKDLPV